MSLTIISGCSSPPMELKQIADCELAGNVALHAAISSNSYLRSDRVWFPVEEISWYKVDLMGNPISSKMPSYSNRFAGLAIDVWEQEGSKSTIFAFRGTDSKWDYMMANLSFPISIQYKSANKKFKKYQERASRDITVTGHSLGGGLALSVYTKNKNINVIVFDSSPRVFDGWGHEAEEGHRMLVFQKGEVLEKVRKRCNAKIDELVPSVDRYFTKYQSPKLDPHRSDLIAIGLVKQGSECDEMTGKLKELMELEELEQVLL